MHKACTVLKMHENNFVWNIKKYNPALHNNKLWLVLVLCLVFLQYTVIDCNNYKNVCDKQAFFGFPTVILPS